MYNLTDIIKTTVCYVWKLLKRVNPKKSSHHKENFYFYFFNFISVWNDGCSLNILWYSFHDIHFIMLYTLNLYSAVCQLIAQWNWKERKKEGRRERKRERERKKGGRKEGREGAREGGSHQKKKKSNRHIWHVHGIWSLYLGFMNSLPTTWLISYVHLNMDGKVNWRGYLSVQFVLNSWILKRGK